MAPLTPEEEARLLKPDDSHKVLLLGTSESGKSTVLKSMKLVLEGSYTSQECDAFKEIVFGNTVQSMRVVLEAMESLELPLDDQRNGYHAQTIFMQPAKIEEEYLSEKIRLAIETLWKDSGVRQAFGRSREYQLNDAAA